METDFNGVYCSLHHANKTKLWPTPIEKQKRVHDMGECLNSVRDKDVRMPWK